MRGFCVATLLFASAIPTQLHGQTAAPSQSAPGVNDVQCVIVSNAIAKVSKNEARKQVVALNMLHFYFGRIDGHFSDAQLKVEIAAQGKKITKANLPTIAQNCLTAMQARLKRMQALRL